MGQGYCCGVRMVRGQNRIFQGGPLCLCCGSIRPVKRQVIDTVGTDGFYALTETMLFADEGTNAVGTAADLAAQAEHDALDSPILLTTSRALTGAVAEQLAGRLRRSGAPIRHGRAGGRYRDRSGAGRGGSAGQ